MKCIENFDLSLLYRFPTSRKANFLSSVLQLHARTHVRHTHSCTHARTQTLSIKCVMFQQVTCIWTWTNISYATNNRECLQNVPSGVSSYVVKISSLGLAKLSNNSQCYKLASIKCILYGCKCSMKASNVHILLLYAHVHESCKHKCTHKIIV